jgi:hypothetical protein
MRLIAHRGLIDGPDKDLENNPAHINTVLNQRFDCEIDVRYVDGKWFLGHDAPTYLVDFRFLQHPGLWIHAKNLDALYILTGTYLNYFWHQEDNFTLTSNGYIWTYPGEPLTNHSVMVMPEYTDSTLQNTVGIDCYAICSDHITQISSNYPNR